MNADEVIAQIKKIAPDAEYKEGLESGIYDKREFLFENKDNVTLYLTKDKKNISSAYLYSGTFKHLDNSKDKEITDILTRIDSLETLSIGGYLEKSKYNVSMLKNLNKLYIENFATINLKITGLENLKSLKEFHTIIEQFPPELLALPLTDLGIMQASCIPEEIGKIKTLQSFSFMESTISKIPESITSLANLTLLGLGKNKIKYLPENIGELKNLKSLMLFNNELTELPLSMLKLEQLEDLNIEGNKIESLPGEFFKLPNLKNFRTDKIEVYYGKKTCIFEVKVKSFKILILLLID